MRPSKSRPEGRLRVVTYLGWLVVHNITNGILHVASNLVSGALRLIDLCFVLELLVAGYLASAFLDGAFGLFGESFHCVHDPYGSPHVGDTAQRSQVRGGLEREYVLSEQEERMKKFW